MLRWDGDRCKWILFLNLLLEHSSESNTPEETCDIWFVSFILSYLFVNLFFGGLVCHSSLIKHSWQVLSSPVLHNRWKAVTYSCQTFYISFYSWGLRAAVRMMAGFIMSRMKVVKVSVYIYYFWSLSDCICMTLCWLNVPKCMSCLFIKLKVFSVRLCSGIFKRMKMCRCILWRNGNKKSGINDSLYEAGKNPIRYQANEH